MDGLRTGPAPEPEAHGNERGPRERGFYLMSLMATGFGVLFIPVNVARGATTVAALDAIMAGALLLNLAWFRRTRKVELHGLASLTIVVLCLLPMTWRLGAQIYLWFAAIPPLAFFLLGMRWGGTFVAGFLLLVGAWLVAFPPAWIAGQFPVAMMASLTLMTALSFIYERAKHAYASELRRLSNIDPLTGCFNRRQGNHILDQERRRVTRYDRPLSLVLIDIDHFKQINDEHGHEAGDRVLQEVALRIRSTLRASDAVVRWGGEEFLVVLPETDALGARAAAERLLHQVAVRPIDPAGTVTVSAGATPVAPDRDDDLRRTLHRADTLLYEAKRSGRNRVCVDLVTPREVVRRPESGTRPATG